jgi:hypothetical protein
MSAIRYFRILSLGAAVLACGAKVALATEFASTVVNDNLGNSATIDPGYQNVSAAVTAPTGYTGTDFGFPSVVTPFNPVFDYDQLVVIGQGGSIELQFPTTVTPSSGLDIGVFTNVGLDDNDFPSGVATNPATLFSSPNSAVVQVSENGTKWVALNGGNPISMTIPTDFYSNNASLTTTPSDEVTIPSGVVDANFGEPFAGTLNDFNGEDYAQIESTLGGSAGGTWLSLGGTGLSGVNFIEFQVPDDGSSQLGLAAVSVNDLPSVVVTVPVQPSTVPLPSAFWSGLTCLGGLMFAVCRSSRRRGGAVAE